MSFTPSPCFTRWSPISVASWGVGAALESRTRPALPGCWAPSPSRLRPPPGTLTCPCPDPTHDTRSPPPGTSNPSEVPSPLFQGLRAEEKTNTIYDTEKRRGKLWLPRVWAGAPHPFSLPSTGTPCGAKGTRLASQAGRVPSPGLQSLLCLSVPPGPEGLGASPVPQGSESGLPRGELWDLGARALPGLLALTPRASAHFS